MLCSLQNGGGHAGNGSQTRGMARLEVLDQDRQRGFGEAQRESGFGQGLDKAVIELRMENGRVCLVSAQSSSPKRATRRQALVDVSMNPYRWPNPTCRRKRGKRSADPMPLH
jgi:hypothetical protein